MQYNKSCHAFLCKVTQVKGCESFGFYRYLNHIKKQILLYTDALGAFYLQRTLGDGNVLAHILAIPVLPIFTAQLSKNTASKEKAQGRIHTELPECTAATTVTIKKKKKKDLAGDLLSYK